MHFVIPRESDVLMFAPLHQQQQHHHQLGRCRGGPLTTAAPGFLRPNRRVLSSNSSPFLDLFHIAMDQSEQQRQQNQTLDAKVDVSGFNPEDLKVEVDLKTRRVSVRAEKVDGAGSRYLEQHFSLPAGCHPEALKCAVWKDGFLHITAAASAAPAEGEKNVDADEESLVKPVDDNKEEEKEQSDRLRPEELPVAVQQEECNNNENQTLTTDPTSRPDFEFSVKIDDGFDPADISVEVDESGRVTVSAHREEKDGENNFSSRSFVRKVLVSKSDYDLDLLTSKLGKDGMLTVTAPRRKNEL